MAIGLIEWIKRWVFRVFLFCLVIALAVTLGNKWPEVVHGIFVNTYHSIVGILTGHTKIKLPTLHVKKH